MFESKEEKERFLLKIGWKYWTKTDRWQEPGIPALYSLDSAYKLGKQVNDGLLDSERNRG